MAGVFTMIAMTGLDQDMMQRNLSCKNFKDSQKNMITSGISQFFVILLFLMLGVLLYTFTAQHGIENPEKSDELFTSSKKNMREKSFSEMVAIILPKPNLRSEAINRYIELRILPDRTFSGNRSISVILHRHGKCIARQELR